MTECERIPDTNRKAICIRNSLAEKLWLEMQGHGVSLLNYVFLLVVRAIFNQYCSFYC